MAVFLNALADLLVNQTVKFLLNALVMLVFHLIVVCPHVQLSNVQLSKIQPWFARVENALKIFAARSFAMTSLDFVLQLILFALSLVILVIKPLVVSQPAIPSHATPDMRKLSLT
jgi:hypothetical protein